MTGPDREHLRLLRARRQPDGVSCGASCVVAVPMLLDPAAAARLGAEDAWRQEVLRTHREIIGVRDPRAPGTTPPWPRRLGTPPWAAARRLRAEPGGGWDVRTVRGGRHGDGWAALVAGARSGRPGLLCVGSTLSPRHFLLVLPDAGDGEQEEAGARERLQLWDPARGEVRPLGRDGFLAGAITGGRFATPWFVVTADPVSPAAR